MGCSGQVINAGNHLTKPYGLTSARWQVMGAINLNGDALTVAQIARRMGLARQGVQRIVYDLEKLDMLTLETNIDHKRAPLVSLSETGQKTISQIMAAQTEWFNQLSNGLSQRQIEQALKILQTVREKSEKLDLDKNQGVPI